MTTYLIDVFTRKNEVLMSNLIREASSDDDVEEIKRLEWQLGRANYDVNMSDLIAVAIYTKNMETIERYDEGIAYYEGEELIDKIEKVLFIAESNRRMFAGWNIKTYVVPVLTRAFILAGKDISILERVFNTYPYENRITIDLANLYNFNGQMTTVRTRNRYSLEETAYSYGVLDSLERDEVGLDPELTLKRRIRLQKELYELRGLSWE